MRNGILRSNNVCESNTGPHRSGLGPGHVGMPAALRIVTHHPLSCRSPGRWDDIDSQFGKCDIVGLQGTQCSTYLPCKTFALNMHNVLHWGRATGKKGRLTGGSVLICKRHFPRRLSRRQHLSAFVRESLSSTQARLSPFDLARSHSPRHT